MVQGSQSKRYLYSMNPLAGLILCGGQSTRMGEDKCQIRYHGKPQWVHLAEMLKPFCKEVVVSCSPKQAAVLKAYNTQPLRTTLVPDSPKYIGQGPMGGLLTAWDAFPNYSFLLAACDYPLLTGEDFSALIKGRADDPDAVCFEREGMDEPLVALYEKSAAESIRQLFRQGRLSLRHALKMLDVERLQPIAGNHLVSVDTPEQRKDITISTGRASG